MIFFGLVRPNPISPPAVPVARSTPVSLAYPSCPTEHGDCVPIRKRNRKKREKLRMCQEFGGVKQHQQASSVLLPSMMMIIVHKFPHGMGMHGKFGIMASSYQPGASRRSSTVLMTMARGMNVTAAAFFLATVVVVASPIATSLAPAGDKDDRTCKVLS
jgi:hypothetical protein